MPFLQVDGTPFHYREAGDGPVLVMLHGLGASLEDWEFQIPFFSEDFRCIAIDLRGFGKSGRGKGGLSLQRFADDVWSVLSQLQVHRFFLIGHSMGGAVALQLTLDHPQAVGRLVICNSVPAFVPQTLKQHFEVWYRMLVMRLLGPFRMAQIGAMRMFPHPDQAALREKSIQRGSRGSSRNYVQALRALTRWSVISRLHELQMPVLVLAAEHDYFTREEMLQFAHALPRGRFHLFANTHHGLPLEAPEHFNRVVRKFLRGAA
jgi:pimeloyl-ACP methyl ester carboxylesterase